MVTLMFTEDMVGALLLIGRHAVIKRFEGRNKPPQALGMLIGDDLKRFEIVNRGHVAILQAHRTIRRADRKRFAVISHDLGDGPPQLLLLPGDSKLLMQFLYPALSLVDGLVVMFGMRRRGRGRLIGRLGITLMDWDKRQERADERRGRDRASGSSNGQEHRHPHIMMIRRKAGPHGSFIAPSIDFLSGVDFATLDGTRNWGIASEITQDKKHQLEKQWPCHSLRIFRIFITDTSDGSLTEHFHEPHQEYRRRYDGACSYRWLDYPSIVLTGPSHHLVMPT